MDIIREFNTANFIVRVEALPEADTDFSFDESGEVEKKVASGEWVAFTAKASVILKANGAQLAADYLGECIYSTIGDFEDHRFGAASYFADMIKTVISDARAVLNEMPQVRAA